MEKENKEKNRKRREPRRKKRERGEEGEMKKKKRIEEEDEGEKKKKSGRRGERKERRFCFEEKCQWSPLLFRNLPVSTSGNAASTPSGVLMIADVAEELCVMNIHQIKWLCHNLVFTHWLEFALTVLMTPPDWEKVIRWPL